jgi:hypothetical protein
LILPHLRATEISPRFQNSVGKTLKDHKLKRIAEEEAQRQSQERQRIKNITEIRALSTIVNHDNVIVEASKHYSKRTLDAEGHWTNSIGRTMATDEKMVLKDYGKTKFFQNPLQLTER